MLRSIIVMSLFSRHIESSMNGSTPCIRTLDLHDGAKYDIVSCCNGKRFDDYIWNFGGAMGGV